MKNNFAVIIPTHERQHYFIRSMKYYEKISEEAEVIYCDSSEKKYSKTIPSAIKYYHMPGASFQKKILRCIELTNSDFIALSADDDFLLIPSLLEAYEILSRDDKISSVRGTFVGFNEKYNGKFFQFYQNMPSNITGTIEERIKSFFTDYFQILWSMFRKEILKSSFEVISKSNFKNDNFIELIIGTIACHFGNISTVSNTWGAREKANNDHWGKRHVPISQLDDNAIIEELDLIVPHIDSITTHGLFKLALSTYIYSYKYKEKNINLFLKIIKRFIPSKMKSIFRVIKRYLFSGHDYMILNEDDAILLRDIDSILNSTTIY